MFLSKSSKIIIINTEWTIESYDVEGQFICNEFDYDIKNYI